jgi:hypothetical protein
MSRKSSATFNSIQDDDPFYFLIHKKCYLRIYTLNSVYLIPKKMWMALQTLLFFAKICQYSETSMIHILFSLLRIKDLYMFWALLAHFQEVLHKWHLVYCMLVMSVSCNRSTSILVQPSDITRMQCTKCRLFRASWGWAGNAWNM